MTEVNPQQDVLWGAQAAEAGRKAFLGVDLAITQGWRSEDWYIAGYACAGEDARGWEILYRTELRRNSLDAIFVKALVAAADKVEHEKFCKKRWPTMNERECTCVRRELDAALAAFARSGDGVAKRQELTEDAPVELTT